MKARVQKKEDHSAVARHPGLSSKGRASGLIDNRPAATAQRMLHEAANSNPQTVQLKALSNRINNSTGAATMSRAAQLRNNQTPLQAPAEQQPQVAQPQQTSTAPNKTGLPNQLKSGIESLSGMPMDHVRVHYNSAQPAQLNALAYAQGNQIHLGPGQEKHLPHEAWHVVQQAQGRVRPTIQAKGIPVNDDHALEHEADVMGARALQTVSKAPLRAERQVAATNGLAPVQQLPDQTQIYLKRVQRVAGLGAGALVAAPLEAYIVNPANVREVGRPVARSVNNAFHPAAGGGLPINMLNLSNAVTAGLAARAAVPGQYAADTAHNAALSGVLQANPFIQSIMDGSLHNKVPTQRHGAHIGGAIPGLGAAPDDRVLEAANVFNRVTNRAPLPAVNINPISAPHAAMNMNGQLSLGWAAARGNIVHEFGHHLENNLSPKDLLTLHNFLTARTRVPAGGMPAGPMGGMRDAGYVFEHHPGYNIDMPKINAGGLLGRKTPQTTWEHIKHAVGTPFKAIEHYGARAWHAFAPTRYLGLVGSGLKQQLGRLIGYVSGSRKPRNWGGHGVENLFVHNANNRQLSYASATHDFNTAWYTGTTEYLSTTVEFFNRPSHTRELVRVDPLRVALFLYLANRRQYNQVKKAFNALAPGNNLDNLIHTVR